VPASSCFGVSFFGSMNGFSTINAEVRSPRRLDLELGAELGRVVASRLRLEREWRLGWGLIHIHRHMMAASASPER
jgi:hypothetical protein